MFGGVGGFHGGFGGELVLRDPVEAEGLAREVDVVRDVGLFADELVGLDDEAGDVPGGDLHEEEADDCGHGRENQPAQRAGARRGSPGDARRRR